MPTNYQGFGLDYYGVGPWGIGTATGTFSLESIFANSERTVRVTFTDSALVGTALLAGAALNVSTWSISADGTPLTLLAVRQVDTDGRQFELYTLQKFPDRFGTIEVSFPSILDANGDPIVGATSGDCAGAKHPPRQVLVNRAEPADIANVVVDSQMASGIIPTLAGGDYAKQSGDVLLEKMIYRRASAVPGDFAYIPPENFGLGLRPKEILLLNDVPALRAEVERQVSREPDVADVRAAVMIDDDGLVFIQIDAKRASTGGQLKVAVPLSGTVVQL
jgi:hypothetical protein